MKDHIRLAQGLVTALIKDAVIRFPRIKPDLERDLDRLLNQVKSRGLNVLTIELPDLGKHFEKCLSQGQFTPSNLPNGRLVSRRHRIQRLFAGLMQLIFDNQGRIREDADPDAVFLLENLFFSCKKLRLECAPERLFETVKEFFCDEADLPPPSTYWYDDSLSHPRLHARLHFNEANHDDLVTPLRESSDSRSEGDKERDRVLLDTLQATADRVVCSIGEYIPDATGMRHGPGAVSEKVRTSKFEFPSWTARLDRVFPESEFRFADLGKWLDSQYSQSIARQAVLAVEPHSKLIAVPKTQKGPRLIASEPVSHQYTQQGIRGFLATSIGKSLIGKSVTIENQIPSRELALKASATGSHATIDLKAASDRMSCWVVERLMRVNHSLLSALKSSRTLDLVNDIDKKHPRKIRLAKFAPMGSAVTFPVQSIFYACAAIAAVLATRMMDVSDRNIRKVASEVIVYGDDIIIPTDSVKALFRLLERTWFKVNYSKSFTEGNFREACGIRAFRGHDVTPAYVLEPFDETRPSSVSSVIEASNNFFLKGLWETTRYLESTVPRVIHKDIPVKGSRSGAVGFVSFVGADSRQLRSRWNKDLHRMELRSLRLDSKVLKSEPEGTLALFQRFVENPRPESIWSAGLVRRVTQSLRRSWIAAEALASAD